jgi:hypothetical protein
MDGKLVNTELVQLVKLIMLLTCRERERELQILSDEKQFAFIFDDMLVKKTFSKRN